MSVHHKPNKVRVSLRGIVARSCGPYKTLGPHRLRQDSPPFRRSNKRAKREEEPSWLELLSLLSSPGSRELSRRLNFNVLKLVTPQEELAFVLEMLGLYDEALVQYDELDALFTQFVLNSNVGGNRRYSKRDGSRNSRDFQSTVLDTPAWLGSFQTPLNNWAGVNLENGVDHHLRLLLAECKASLLDLRSYLFSRQCAMLLLTNKPWEVRIRIDLESTEY